MKKWLALRSKATKGFTLIEILVVIGIIVFLSAIILPNLRLGEKQSVLQRSAAKLAQDLRRAQEMVLSGKEYSCWRYYPRLKGYGMNFYDHPALPAYAYFYSSLVKCQNDAGEADVRTIERIDLEKGVKIKELKKDGIVIYSLYVYFYPPDPQVDLQGASEVKIILSLESDLNTIKTITINKAGLIDVK